jgi:hypothetical protein
VQATQRHSSPQPPSSSDRISLLRLAEHVSRNIGPIPATLAIREKWLTGEVRIWVQWILGHSFGGRGKASLTLGEEQAPASFLEDLEQRGLTAPGSNWRGLNFQNIIDASESGLYVDRRSACLFTSRLDVDRRAAACLFTSRVEAAQFWPWLDEQPKADEQSKTAPGRRSPRGAKTAWNWEEAVIAASAYAYEHGLPEKQADLVRYIAEWFGDPGPGETQIKAHIAPLYRALARASGR